MRAEMTSASVRIGCARPARREFHRQRQGELKVAADKLNSTCIHTGKTPAAPRHASIHCRHDLLAARQANRKSFAARRPMPAWDSRGNRKEFSGSDSPFGNAVRKLRRLFWILQLRGFPFDHRIDQPTRDGSSAGSSSPDHEVPWMQYNRPCRFLGSRPGDVEAGERHERRSSHFSRKSQHFQLKTPSRRRLAGYQSN